MRRLNSKKNRIHFVRVIEIESISIVRFVMPFSGEMVAEIRRVDICRINWFKSRLREGSVRPSVSKKVTMMKENIMLINDVNRSTSVSFIYLFQIM